MFTRFFVSDSYLWSLAGWTMIHYLCLGAAVAAAAFLSRWMLRRASANVRYAVALTWLTLLAALPVVIASWLATNPTPLKGGARGGTAITAGTPMRATLPNTITARQPGEVIELNQPAAQLNSPAVAAASDLPAAASVGSSETEPSPNPSLSGRGSLFAATFEAVVPYLPWLWIIGTPITFALTATGVFGTRRLRGASRPVADGPIAEILARLTASLRVGRRVTVAVCDRIASPVLIGILRPIILLPPAALTGYSPDEIEMVLLHELAHVRRWDNLVNLVQRIIESLLFFHPAVWLVSSWVRREREACCDALVVSHTDHPHAYAELLVALAAQMPRSVLFHPAASSAMAAGPLRARIRRILKLDDDPMLISGKSFALVLASLIVAATLAVLYLPTAGQAEESSKPAAEAKNERPTEVERQQVKTKNNLKNLGLALLNYQAAKHQFPSHAIYSADGKPLLSWRVEVLPFFDRKLYDEFHLNEPWDSEHNRKLIARMPEVFRNPKISEPGKTNYLGVVGPECFFTGTPRKLGVAQISDGTANTIALVEADPNQAVEWTRPLDWKFDRDRPTQGLGQLWGDCWFSTFVDGSVHRKKNSESPNEVGIQFTRAGRETRSLAESENRPVPSPTDLNALAASPGEAGPSAEGGPQALPPDAAAPPQQEAPLLFRLKRDVVGEAVLFLNGQPVSDAEVQAEVKRHASLDDLPVSLSAGEEIKYAEVMRVIDLLESLGLRKLALDTRHVDPKQQADEPPAKTSIKSDLKTFASFEKSLATVEFVVVVFNGTGEQAKAMDQVWKQLSPTMRSLYIYGIQLDPASEEAKRYRLHAGSTCLVFFKRKEIGRFVDIQDTDQLQSYVRDTIKTATTTAQPSATPGDSSGKQFISIVPNGEDRERRVRAYIEWLFSVNDANPIQTRNYEFTADIGKELRPEVEAFPTQPFWKSAYVLKTEWNEDATKVSITSTKAFHEYISNQFKEAARPLAPRYHITKTNESSATKFPTLEEQKLADLAFKRLGLELETLSSEDLKRVKALGYDGGLKVIVGAGGAPGSRNMIEPDDILVGLHAWPTTTMQDLAQILNRNDLVDLNPLKFYVVRPHPAQTGPIPAGPMPDHVVTGRIDVIPSGKPSANRLDPRSSSDTNKTKPRTFLDTNPVRTSPEGWSVPATPEIAPTPPTRPPAAMPTSNLHRYAPPTSATPDEPRPPLSPFAESEPLFSPEPPEQSEAEKRLAGEIKNRFKSSKLKNFRIAVQVRDGEAYLSGIVAENSHKNIAVQIARETEGISKVFNSLMTPEEAPQTPFGEEAKSSAAPNPYIPRVNIQPPALSARPVPAVASTAPIAPTATAQPWSAPQPTPQVPPLADAHVALPSSPRPAGLPTEPNPPLSPKSPAAEKSVVTKTDNVPPTAANAGSSSDELVLIAYEIPAALRAEVEKYLGSTRLRHSWDDTGRLILQAFQSRHRQFKSLLTDTDKWREPNKVKDRAAASIELEKVDGKTVLRWRAFGVSFTSNENDKSIFPQFRGVRVVDVEPGSTAAWNDVQSGDALYEIGGFQITSLKDLESVIKTIGESFKTKKYGCSFFRKDPDRGGNHVNSNFQVIFKDTSSESGGHSAPQAEIRADKLTVTLTPDDNSKQQPSTRESDKKSLRYDGKSFNEWRNSWQTELSHEKRLAAVKALAAFGANGYGKEASTAILDVAGEYDFQFLDSEPEGKLKQGVIDVLASSAYYRPSLAKYWIPDLTARMRKEPKRWNNLASHLFYELRTYDPQVVAEIESLAASDLPELRSVALTNLVYSRREGYGGTQFDDKTRALLLTALKSKDVEEIKNALSLLLYGPAGSGGGGGGGGPKWKLLFLPELIPLLFHADESVRQLTRDRLRYASEKDAPAVLEAIVAVLKDKSRERDHIDAIRAITALGVAAQSSMQKTGAARELTELCKRTEDRKLLIAALVAWARTMGKEVRLGDLNDPQAVLRDGEIEADIDKILAKIGPPTDEYKAACQLEEESITGTKPITTAGGGGFF